MGFKASLVNIVRERLTPFLKYVRYDRTYAHQSDLLILGETLLTAKMALWDTPKMPFIPSFWDDYGFRVFSQNNEDGLIQYIIHHTDIPSRSFIEFGVEDYSECNTRFLIMHNNWSGLVMDGSEKAMQDLRRQNIYIRRQIESKSAFITRDNINSLISSSGYSGKIGLLSVDIDGNDYWVLEAIECIQPQILICEFNPLFGAEEKVAIPYKEDFYRHSAHYSGYYYGASLNAFTHLANSRGYKLVCINNLGNNAFFVKKDATDLPEVTPMQSWRGPMHREATDKQGNFTFMSYADGRKLLADMPVIDTVTGQARRIGDLKA